MTTHTRRTGPERTPLDLTDVVVDDAFWSPRREVVREHTLPHQEHQLRTGGQLEALRLGWRPGDPREPHIFWESDVAKWIEAASYSLAVTQDPALDAAVDEAIELLAGAQQPDGYLNVYFTVVRPGERFTDLRDAHELYCAGHLMEAAVAHHEATGKRSLLDVVCRYADLIDREFGPGGSCEGGYDGHQEIELALVRLYRATGERRYLELSARLLDARGTQPYYFELEEERRGTPGYFGTTFGQRARDPQRFREYNQSHLPVRDQREVVGHSVRAMYMLSAMADLAAELGDDGLRAAAERLWDSTTRTKMYVTGGLGSDPSIEGFGPEYDLPDEHGYAETCAAIGLVMSAQRMACLTGEARYVDVLERALYNGVLSGASSDGTHYFYGNPLASNGDVHRHEWFGVACCPPNLARLLMSLGRYAYARGPAEAVVNLFVGGHARFRLGDGAVTVTQRTGYPADGTVELEVDTDGDPGEVTLAVRVPAWATAPVARLNGQDVDLSGVTDGYLRLRRTWTSGDRVTLELGMTPQRVWADTRVGSAAGKVALQRGPVVYCLEGVDHPVPVRALTLPRDAALSAEPGTEPVSGLVALTADGLADHDPDHEPGADGALYRTEPPVRQPTTVRAVPYFAWANRGRSTMTVWVREA